MTGGREEPPGRVGAAPSSSAVISDISTKSRSRIFFTTFMETAAAGLNGPKVVKLALVPFRMLDEVEGDPSPPLNAAAANRSRPAGLERPAPKTGTELGRVSKKKYTEGGHNPCAQYENHYSGVKLSGSPLGCKPIIEVPHEVGANILGCPIRPERYYRGAR